MIAMMPAMILTSWESGSRANLESEQQQHSQANAALRFLCLGESAPSIIAWRSLPTAVLVMAQPDTRGGLWQEIGVANGPSQINRKPAAFDQALLKPMLRCNCARAS
jgi:hypothetical protein